VSIYCKFFLEGTYVGIIGFISMGDIKRDIS
jgi:hypothetical protein